MAWYRMEASFRSHRKVRRIQRTLGISIVEARGLMVGLWCVVCDESPDGCLSDWDAADIASAAGWDGDPATFVEALMAAGFIDLTESGAEIHKWMERAESYKTAKRVQSNRKNRKNNGKKESAVVTEQYRNGNVTDHDGNSDCNGTVPEQLQNSTVDRPTDGWTDVKDPPNQDLLSADDLVAKVSGLGWGLYVASKWTPLLSQLAPFTSQEIKEAVEETKVKSTHPNIGYVLRVVERIRTEPPEARKHPPPGSEWAKGRVKEGAERKNKLYKREDPPRDWQTAKAAIGEIVRSLDRGKSDVQA